MTRLAWITPGYPPDRGGVSDHSGAMVSELRRLGHDVLVCSKPHEQGFPELDAELKSFGAEAVVVAYVPLGFAPHTGGLSPAFLLWCKRLGARHDLRRILLAHEVCLPAEEHWRRLELELALLGGLQMAQFAVMAHCFEVTFFSHESNRSIWVTRLPKLAARFRTLRICSSVPVADSSDPRVELQAAGHSVPKKTVLFFGMGHASVLFDYVVAALLDILKSEPQAQLVIVGMDAQKLRRVSPKLAGLGAHVQTLGFVPARQVSLWLQVADLVLAPLAEGVNARKTTIMAAFEHGRAVVTTTGFHTRDDIPWARLCVLSPLDAQTFAIEAARCFTSEEERARLGSAARADYLSNASASVTAARLNAALAPSAAY